MTDKKMVDMGKAHAQIMDSFITAFETVLEQIEEQCTIDPESLRPKGRWVRDEESAKWGYPFICTAKGCGKAHNYTEKYCPNCGAKMEE